MFQIFFSEEYKILFSNSIKLMVSKNQNILTINHLLFTMLSDNNYLANDYIVLNEEQRKEILNILLENINRIKPILLKNSTLRYHNILQKLINKSEEEMNDNFNCLMLNTLFILLALVKYNLFPKEVQHLFSFDYEVLKEQILKDINDGKFIVGDEDESNNKNDNDNDDDLTDLEDENINDTILNNSNPKIFKQSLTNLTEEAKNNKLDPVIGKMDEINRIIEILFRKKKNNPILLGEAGVGKTAIVEGLANYLVHSDNPELNKFIILSVSLSNLMAGASCRGVFEKRVLQIIDKALKNPNIILFIDEIHNIISYNDNSQGMDAANILKPYLARGQVKLIGATTIDEYRKSIDKDGAMARRLQPIFVEESSINETIQILEGCKDIYSKYYDNVIFEDDIIPYMVSLADRFIQERKFPDKAFDIMDEVCASFKVNKNNLNIKDNIITKEFVNRVVSKMTKIDINELNEDEIDRLFNMENRLKEVIIGHDKPISKISKYIRKWKSGLSDKNKPIVSLLAVGDSGVGKTYFGKKVAEYMFGNEDKVVYLDMSEYSNESDVSKILGSSYGYVGYGKETPLVKQMRLRPHSVVIFDNIDKANKSVFNVLVEIIDTGKITSGDGKEISFKNSIIIFTTNQASQNLKIKNNKIIGFDNNKEKKQDTEKEKMERVVSCLKNIFPIQFINKLDDILLFENLTEEDLKKIFKFQLNKFVNNYQINWIIDEDEDEFFKYIFDKIYKKDEGIKSILNIIKHDITDKLCEIILKEKFKPDIKQNIYLSLESKEDNKDEKEFILKLKKD